ncbi:ACP S-malonyltransferase [Bacillus cereus]|uniref:ACP S-malonyltransferase n=1 Tax=Bacillus cereus TaxID=1396 RepID=UPI000BF74988|nr:ACP S-malonyltransferase [Bacillus cereus]PFD11835.1 malonyl CoA-ACP transacylase [Bacillus cereus]PFD49339.1 malonyl CoA-ACP transacylase [Bacillus cereus]PFH85374.1 malonyl CoA-ACP transacylase [Bacillus cereus]PFJ96044.1 malonyl CoA-ACP transacylase [Bacillus cereus]
MITFIFPGQGSQSVGMCKGYLDKYPNIFVPLFEEANDTLGFDLKQLCLYGPSEKLIETSVTQPAILTVSTGISRILHLYGIRPSKVAGHSLGQFSALVEAGSLQFQDALSIVRKRGQLMSNVKQEGCMLGIVSNTYQTLFEVVEESKQYEIDIAAYNSPTQVVFSGESKSILKFQKVLDQKNGIKTKILSTSHAFHSRLMGEMVLEFKEHLNLFSLKNAQIPIVLNCSGKPTTDRINILQDIERQCVGPVMWQDTIYTLLNNGTKHFIEVGPGNTLTKLCRSFKQNISVSSTETPMYLKRSLTTIEKEFKGERVYV